MSDGSSLRIAYESLGGDELCCRQCLASSGACKTASTIASRCHKLHVLLVLFVVGILLLLYYMYTLSAVDSTQHNYWLVSEADAMQFARKKSTKQFSDELYSPSHVSFDDFVEGRVAPFNMTTKDVIVFVHVQKTAGTTFERFLTRHLAVRVPCVCSNKHKKKCKCYRRASGKKEHWLFSRFSTGWSCGLHADWTELVVSNCADNMLDRREGQRVKRRYFYTTFIREPISRYISEFRHVQRGATWQASRHMCNGRPASATELPMCFDPDVGHWANVTLDAFMDCPYNLAANRQTRMLADLTLVHCYDQSAMPEQERARILLQSAKANLARRTAFYGIKEAMNESQWMFETLFRMEFNGNMANWTRDKSSNTSVSAQQLTRIRQLNALDIELYKFAVKLFNSRLALLRDRVRSEAVDEESVGNAPDDNAHEDDENGRYDDDDDQHNYGT